MRLWGFQGASSGITASANNSSTVVPSLETKRTPGTTVLDVDEGTRRQCKEKEELHLLLEGAPNRSDELREGSCFLGSNTRHMYVDAALGITVYSMSGLQHLSGQSNGLTLLSMWAAGTTYLVNFAIRRYLNEVTSTSLLQDVTASMHSSMGKSTNGSRSYDGIGSRDALQAEPSLRAQVSQSSLISDVATQKRNAFQLEAVASWVWMLTSLQQFKLHKRLRWSGYSSWMGLGCSVYYTFRHLYCILVN